MTDPEILEPEVHPVAVLLPWYLSGTLPTPERERVDQHLQTCADCRAELSLLQAMRADVDAVESAVRPSSRAFETVMAQVRAEAPARARSAQPERTKPAGLVEPRGPRSSKRLGLLDQLAAATRALFAPKWVPAAAVAVLVVQFGVLF